MAAVQNWVSTDDSPSPSFGLGTDRLPSQVHWEMTSRSARNTTTDVQKKAPKQKELGFSDSYEVVRKRINKCDYPNCPGAFQRKVHLSRHKQTSHGESPNRFVCEFCGKDQFNRQDNVNNHRKLHARPNSRNRGVKFIAAAVPVIEQEERSRKSRAPPRSRNLSAAEKEHKQLLSPSLHGYRRFLEPVPYTHISIPQYGKPCAMGISSLEVAGKMTGLRGVRLAERLLGSSTHKFPFIAS